MPLRRASFGHSVRHASRDMAQRPGREDQGFGQWVYLPTKECMPQTAMKRGISVWRLQRRSAFSLLWSWAKPPVLWARNFCWLKPQSLWNFRAALGNRYGQLQWCLVFIIFYYCACRICGLGRCLYHSTFVEEGRGQRCGVSSLLPPLCGF